MDVDKRNALVERIGDVNNRNANLPLVTLETFFEGNDDGGSIWCNLEAAPEPQQVFSVLDAIRQRNDVADVRILITQYDGGDEWPFSDTIYFITRGSPEDVESWLGETYAADEVYLADLDHAEPYEVPEGMNIVAAWWD